MLINGVTMNRIWILIISITFSSLAGGNDLQSTINDRKWFIRGNHIHYQEAKNRFGKINIQNGRRENSFGTGIETSVFSISEDYLVLTRKEAGETFLEFYDIAADRYIRAVSEADLPREIKFAEHTVDGHYFFFCWPSSHVSNRLYGVDMRTGEFIPSATGQRYITLSISIAYIGLSARAHTAFAQSNDFAGPLSTVLKIPFDEITGFGEPAAQTEVTQMGLPKVIDDFFFPIRFRVLDATGLFEQGHMGDFTIVGRFDDRKWIALRDTHAELTLRILSPTFEPLLDYTFPNGVPDDLIFYQNRILEIDVNPANQYESRLTEIPIQTFEPADQHNSLPSDFNANRISPGPGTSYIAWAESQYWMVVYDYDDPQISRQISLPAAAVSIYYDYSNDYVMLQTRDYAVYKRRLSGDAWQFVRTTQSPVFATPDGNHISATSGTVFDVNGNIVRVGRFETRFLHEQRFNAEQPFLAFHQFSDWYGTYMASNDRLLEPLLFLDSSLSPRIIGPDNHYFSRGKIIDRTGHIIAERDFQSDDNVLWADNNSIYIAEGGEIARYSSALSQQGSVPLKNRPLDIAEVPGGFLFLADDNSNRATLFDFDLRLRQGTQSNLLLTLVSGSPASAQLRWNLVDFMTHYTVERRTVGDPSWSEISSINANYQNPYATPQEYMVGDPNVGSQYRFRVIGGNSTSTIASNEVALDLFVTQPTPRSFALSDLNIESVVAIRGDTVYLQATQRSATDDTFSGGIYAWNTRTQQPVDYVVFPGHGRSSFYHEKDDVFVVNLTQSWDSHMMIAFDAETLSRRPLPFGPVHEDPLLSTSIFAIGDDYLATSQHSGRTNLKLLTRHSQVLDYFSSSPSWDQHFWDETNSNLIAFGVNPVQEIAIIHVFANGSITKVRSATESLDGATAIARSPDGRSIIAGNGSVFDGDTLAVIDNTSIEFSKALWTPEGLYAWSNNTLSRYDGASLASLNSAPVDSVSWLFSLPENDIGVIHQVDGRYRIDRYSSNLSKQLPPTPGPASGLNISRLNDGSGQILLTWLDAENETGYSVQTRSPESTIWLDLKSLSANTTSTTANLNVGETLEFRIVSEGANGSQQVSDSFGFTNAPLPAPTAEYLGAYIAAVSWPLSITDDLPTGGSFYISARFRKVGKNKWSSIKSVPVDYNNAQQLDYPGYQPDALQMSLFLLLEKENSEYQFVLSREANVDSFSGYNVAAVTTGILDAELNAFSASYLPDSSAVEVTPILGQFYRRPSDASAWSPITLAFDQQGRFLDNSISYGRDYEYYVEVTKPNGKTQDSPPRSVSIPVPNGSPPIFPGLELHTEPYDTNQILLCPHIPNGIAEDIVFEYYNETTDNWRQLSSSLSDNGAGPVGNCFRTDSGRTLGIQFRVTVTDSDGNTASSEPVSANPIDLLTTFEDDFEHNRFDQYTAVKRANIVDAETYGKPEQGRMLAFEGPGESFLQTKHIPVSRGVLMSFEIVFRGPDIYTDSAVENYVTIEASENGKDWVDCRVNVNPRSTIASMYSVTATASNIHDRENGNTGHYYIRLSRNTRALTDDVTFAIDDLRLVDFEAGKHFPEYNPRTSAIGPSSIEFEWSPISNTSYYIVERDSSNFRSPDLRRKIPGSSRTAFTDTGLVENTRYTYRVAAVTSTSTLPFSKQVVEQTKSAWDLWRDDRLDNRNDIGIASVDYDGLPTVTKYAFNIPTDTGIRRPQVDAANPKTGGLPQSFIDSEGRLCIRYIERRVSYRPSIEYLVEYSSDSIHWSSAGSLVRRQSINSEFDMVEWQDEQPVNTYDNRFVRVRLQPIVW